MDFFEYPHEIFEDLNKRVNIHLDKLSLLYKERNKYFNKSKYIYGKVDIDQEQSLALKIKIINKIIRHEEEGLGKISNEMRVLEEMFQSENIVRLV